jgi:hypothetical protein
MRTKDEDHSGRACLTLHVRPESAWTEPPPLFETAVIHCEIVDSHTEQGVAEMDSFFMR